jgi:hypothetical protein
MALEGNLSAFGLSEILQLIAVQQKSGMLSITSEDRSMVLFFREGSIISTRDRRRRGRDPLKDYLTRYGILTRSDLIRIMEISTKSKLDMTDVIVSEGFLSEENVRKHYRNQIQEAVYEVLSWEQCSYKFIPGDDIVSGLKTWGEYGVEGILMESMRRIDEFPIILEEFPNTSLLVSRTDEDAQQEISPSEKAMLELLDEERTLGFLISHGKMPTFDTYEALKHLKEKGLIRTSGGETAESTEPISRPLAAAASPAYFTRLVPTGFLALIFILSLFIGAKKSLQFLRPQSKEFQHILNESETARDRTEERLRWILEAYRAGHGTYPPSLSHLAETGLVSEGFMKTVEHFSFRYHLTSGGSAYTLL